MADFEETIKNLNNTTDHTGTMNPSDIESNKVMGILAYLSWLVIIPLLAAKDSKFARFHCNQGIVLAIVEIVISILVSILSGIPLIGWIFSLVGGLIGLVCLILTIIGIINVVNGKAKELPLIGGIRILK